MAAIAAGEAEMREALAEVPGVEIAAVNGPASVVVSGDADAVERVVESWREHGCRVRMLRVSHAFHSARMEPVLEELDRAASKVSHHAPKVSWACGVSGELVEEPGAGYWAVQAREAVRYADAVGTLAGQGISVFVEIGPDGTLSGMGPAALIDHAAGSGAVFVPVLRKDVPAGESVLTALAQAYVRGAVVDWAAVLEHGRRVELPTYAFQRQRYWPESATRGESAAEATPSTAEADFWAAVENGDLRELADTLAVDDEQLGGVLPALASWRRQERDDSAVADWRYGISWSRVSEPASAVLSGTWLVVAPSGEADAGLVQGCVRALTDRGAHVVLTETAADKVDRVAFAERITAALPEGAQVAGVVSLLALDEASLAEFPVVNRGVAGMLGLVQALGDTGITAPLWALTQGAVATGSAEAPASPVQAQIWGLGRVVGLEHPDRWGGLIDLPSTWDDRTAARVCALLAGSGEEDQLAVRPAGVMARRLVRAARPASGREQWVPRGSVLITGGTGAIGGNTARWLAGRGAHRLVLTSRSGPAAAEVAALAAELAATGTQVDVVACDSSQRADVAGLLGRIAAIGPSLTGVVHAAGVGQTTPLMDTTVAEQAAVVEAKTAGAVWLDELTADLDLDAFVLFSSIAATWGSGLQPGYAAGNAFLDAMAERRRARGLAATSVAWGVWGGAGMGAGEAGTHLQRHGLRSMDPDLGIQALAQAVDGGDVAVAVADVDWERFAPTFTLRRPSPLIENLPEVRQVLAGADNGDGATVPESQGELGQRLAGLSRAEQDRLLTDLVRTEAAAVLGYASIDVVEPERAFKELGFDSLTAVELRNRLNAATGLQLPATLIFDYPNPMVLADLLRTELNQDGATDSVSIFTELDQLEHNLSSMASDSDIREDVTRRLRGVLSQWIEAQGAAEPEGSGIEFQSATPNEVFNFLDKELGLS
ncbi:SDR family NAD(P)-dependent oxidoreductase [Streptomyces lydicus]|uniref:SDR family NAD(P)-dependent oxidoreductase n=1 Tax=Streptomyces lydicus TaxID=47763 RepID=UPI0037A634E0